MGAQATLREKALVSKTREWELLQLSANKMQSELKSSREELTTLQMEKTATRDKERVELLRFQTELDATKKQLLAEKKESSRLARENEEIRKMFAKLLLASPGRHWKLSCPPTVCLLLHTSGGEERDR
ncbi:hypothetical protein EMCRGX_G004184 [Ephydatia muelleri]